MSKTSLMYIKEAEQILNNAKKNFSNGNYNHELSLLFNLQESIEKAIEYAQNEIIIKENCLIK